MNYASPLGAEVASHLAATSGSERGSGCPVMLNTRSYVRPRGFIRRGLLAVIAVIGKYTCTQEDGEGIAAIC
jgi:hypothetical protein